MENILPLLARSNHWGKDPEYDLGLIRDTYLSAL